MVENESKMCNTSNKLGLILMIFQLKIEVTFIKKLIIKNMFENQQELQLVKETSKTNVYCFGLGSFNKVIILPIF